MESKAVGGPTWLDEALTSGWRPDLALPGVSAELKSAFTAREQWLADRQLSTKSPGKEIVVTPATMTALRKLETERLAARLSIELKAIYAPRLTGKRVHGVYDRAIDTPTGKVAVIRGQDTFTLAPWKPALEPMRGLQVAGSIGPTRVAWSLDRGRSLPPRG